jgi:hypothetical protein
MEYINHFGAIRTRLKGNGNIKGTLFSYDEVRSDILNPTAMSANTDDPVTILADFTTFNAKLRLEVTEIDEYFNISSILIYVKPVANSFPM